MDIGIDLGGSKFFLVTFDSEGKSVEHKRFETPTKYEDFISLLETEVDKVAGSGFGQAAFAYPGLYDHNSGIGISFGTLTEWKNVPLREDLERIFKCPVVLANDAKVAALSEAHLLEDMPEKVLYLTISNGIGGGLIVDGKIDIAAQDSEYGAIMFPFENGLAKWEVITSGSSIVRRYDKKLVEIDDLPTLKAIAYDIGLGVIAVCSGPQPHTFIFGGGGGGNMQKVMPLLEEFLDENLMPTIRRPKLVIAKNPEHAVVDGCRILIQQAKQAA